MFAPDPDPELDAGLPPEAVVPPTADVPPSADVPPIGGLLILESSKFRARGFLRDKRLKELVISSNKISVCESVGGDSSSLK